MIDTVSNTDPRAAKCPWCLEPVVLPFPNLASPPGVLASLETRL